MAQYIVKLVLQWLSVSTVTSDGPVHSEVSVTVVVSFFLLSHQMAQYIEKLVLQWLSVSTVTSDGPVHSEVSVTVVVSFYCHIRWPST